MDKTRQHMEQPTMQETDLLKEEVDLLKKEVNILKKANLGVVLTPEQEKLMYKLGRLRVGMIFGVPVTALVLFALAEYIANTLGIDDLLTDWAIFLSMFIPIMALAAPFLIKKYRALDQKIIEAGLTSEMIDVWQRAQSAKIGKPYGHDYPHSFKYHNPSYPTYRSHVD